MDANSQDKPNDLSESGPGERLPDVSESERILFIGFGQVPGFYNSEWADWDWLNAADFDAAFLNCETLSKLLSRCQSQYVSNPEGFSPRWYDQLSRNLSSLRDQTVQMINSDRAVFALAAPKVTWSVGAGIYKSSVDTYSWCPFPVVLHNESGEVSKDLDPRFAAYRRQLKRWQFYFDDQTRPVDPGDRRSLRTNQRQMLVPRGLFQNLSLCPLGVELRCGILSRAKGTESLDVVSGPIYLLHYPTGGDLQESMRALLREFYETDLVKQEIPAWVDAVMPPRGADLEQQIAELDAQIEVLTQRRSQLIGQRRQLEYWRQLLYETGDGLDQIVLDALELLGLENPRRQGKDNHDIVGELEGETLLCRARGLTGSVNRKDVFELDGRIESYERQNPDGKVTKGVLVANAWRCDPPGARGMQGKQIFTQDTVEHAKLLGFALLDTRVLYHVVSDKIEGQLVDAGQILADLWDTEGIYSYSSPDKAGQLHLGL